jgi:hypothetical protein
MGANDTQTNTEACIPLAIFGIIEASTLIVIIILIIIARLYERNRTAKRVLEGKYGRGNLGGLSRIII